MKEVEQTNFMDAIQKSFNNCFMMSEDIEAEKTADYLKQAISDHSLDDELIKLLPKEFCEKQGYYKSIGASMTKYPNTDKEEQWVRIK